jgi:hypothetical protein
MVRLQKGSEKTGKRNGSTRRNRLFEAICGEKGKDSLHSVE